jgi:predicted MPP superfamily phosphohydrolase
MSFPKPWLILLLVFIGNSGFWLFCFNRANATGLPRYWTKRIEKVFIFLCFAIPCLIAAGEWPAVWEWLGQSSSWWPRDAPGFDVWAVCSLISGITLGPLWLASRRWLIAPRHLLKSTEDHYHVPENIVGQSAADSLTRFLDALPGNQISQLTVTRKVLQLPRSVANVDNLKIGHLSDLHFTGQFSIEHYHFVIDKLLELEPDLIVITGDIIDYDKCLSWIAPLLGKLQAPLGCTYVLGNHDLRLKDFNALTTELGKLGHYDLGVADQHIQLDSGGELVLFGNERPWLERHGALPGGKHASSATESLAKPADDVLRVGLSHSPDQVQWARRLRLDLLLAGHTHGGQVRFPVVGPIVAPSHYGTRFASGVFYLPPTLMHVSRGVAGTHPLRWRCSPEISLLTLRS